MNGNILAYIVLLVWPILSMRWFRVKLIQEAILWTLLGGFLLLAVKTEIDIPMLPALGKHTMPVISVLLGCFLIKKQPVLYFQGLGKKKYLILIFIVSPLVTSLLNPNSIIIGFQFSPGLTYYDGLSDSINRFLLIIPFFIGRRFFRTYSDQLIMFKILVSSALLYSLPMLYEIRMSPQLHTWVYGYFPHSFGQQKRSSGFRPVVFIGHGLWVAFYMMVCLSASIPLWKDGIKVKQFSPAAVSYFLFIMLVLCKSMASLFYAVFLFTFIKWISPRGQHIAAVLLVSVAMLYPAMSILNVFPHEKLLSVASSVTSNDRMQSLKFRFDNEKRLLDHAKEKFYFGWGGWGRNRVYADSGKDITVTDGQWIMTFGSFGVIGFIAEFGLLAVVVIQANRASKYLMIKKERNLLAAHSLLLGIVMVDQLPNATLEAWLWLLVGILLGRSEEIMNKPENSRNLNKV